MQKELSFLVKKVQELHPNDRAGEVYMDILAHLMKINYDETINYINSIEKEYDFFVVSSFFKDLAIHFQRKEFPEILLQKYNAFSSPKYSKLILGDIQEVLDYYEGLKKTLE